MGAPAHPKPRKEGNSWQGAFSRLKKRTPQDAGAADVREQPQVTDIRSHGTVIFNNEKSRAGKMDAKFAVVKTPCPIDPIIDIMLKQWNMGQHSPSVIISITGSANLSLPLSSQEYVKAGLASAARATNAWLVTGGMDTGVMALAGKTMRTVMNMSDTQDRNLTPCIGIAPWRKVTHREKFLAGPAGAPSSSVPSETVDAALGDSHAPTGEHELMYVKRRKNSAESAGLDSNHTHFILVDDGQEDWGGEIKLRADLESELARHFKLPIVLLVLQGGPGTYATVMNAVAQGHMVVLVKESRGAAGTISEYIEPLLGSRLLRAAERHPEVLESELNRVHEEYSIVFRKHNPKMSEERSRKLLDDLRAIAKRLDLLSIFSIASGQSFDRAVLQAVVNSFKRTEMDKRAKQSAHISKSIKLQPLGGKRPLHRRARGPHPDLPARAAVPDAHVSWSVPWDEYEPRPYTAQVVLDNDRTIVPEHQKPQKGWADPEIGLVEYGDGHKEYVPFGSEFVAELRKRLTHEDVEPPDELRRPRNPRGRTGLQNRGLLGKWGANHAADPIVTRFHPTRRGQLQMVGIKRKDTREWALPGGMVDEGEHVSATVKREFKEEASNLGNEHERKKNMQLLDALFSNGRVVYRGYVDDPRNTDNAWLETTAYHFHCDPQTAAFLKLEAGDDAQSVKWIDISTDSKDYLDLYASHKDWVDQVARSLLLHKRCREDRCPKYAHRYRVQDWQVPWASPYPEYKPPSALIASDVVSELNNANASHKKQGRRFSWSGGITKRDTPVTAPPVQPGGPSVPEGSAPPNLHRSPSGVSMARGASFAAAGVHPLVRTRSSAVFDDLELQDEMLQRNQEGILEPRDKNRLFDYALSLRDIHSQQHSDEPGARKTYEAPISWEADPPAGFNHLPRPLNPRGRTGLTGLGLLPRWGPNHMSEVVVTRFHPRGGASVDEAEAIGRARAASGGDATRSSSRGAKGMAIGQVGVDEGSMAMRRDLADLEVLAYVIHDPSSPPVDLADVADACDYVLPSFFTPTDPGCAVPVQLRAALYNEARQFGDVETRERLQHLLQELFSGVDPDQVEPIFCGYADDPRNTDHAWVEVSASHVHLARELGGQLPFLSPPRDGRQLVWVPIGDLELIHASNRDETAWLDKACKLVRQECSQPALLQLVVRWGRNDIAKLVLDDPELVEQRQYRHVQRAFQDALQHSTERLDVTLVETLLEHGAQAAGIYLHGLFEDVADDCFGYLRDLREGMYDKKTTSRHRRLFSLLSAATPDSAVSRRSRTRLPSVRAAVRRPSEARLRTKRQSLTWRGGDERGRGAAAGQRLMGGGGESLGPNNRPSHAELTILTSPWQEKQLNLMASLVKGYDDYGSKQPVVRYMDLMCWAIVVGNLDLAHVMWQRTRSPLRAGLVAESICAKIRESKHTREKELLDAEKRFSEATVGVLNHIRTREEARKLLTGKHSDLSTIGVHGGHTSELLQLAIDLENRAFVAHHHCQHILDEQWKGRSRECGAVMLGRSGRSFEPNDLSTASTERRQKRERGEKVEERRVSWWRTLVAVEMWHIPKVKRYTQLVSMLGFLASFCTVAFQPLCGELNEWHYVFVGWFLSNVVQETHQFVRDAGAYSTNVFNVIDMVIISCLLVASFVRWLLSPTGEQLVPILESAAHEPMSSSIISLLRRAAHRDGGLGSADGAHGVNASLPLSHTLSALPDGACEVSWLVDILRTILGVTAIPLFIRPLEFFTFNKDVGVLLVCLRRMYLNIFNWAVVMVILTIGFSVSFSILAPNFHQGAEFQLAPTPGPLRVFDKWSVALDFSAGGPFFLPFWALYGFFEPGEFAAAPGSSSFAPAVLWVYLLMSLVVLVNLLIAMFNDTYHRVSEDADAQWKMSRVHKVKSYIKQYPAPPPFNVPCLVLELAIRLLRVVASCLFGGCLHEEAPAETQEITDMQAEIFEKNAMEFYLESIGKPKTSASSPAGLALSTQQGARDEALSRIEHRVEQQYEYMKLFLSNQGGGAERRHVGHLRDLCRSEGLLTPGSTSTRARRHSLRNGTSPSSPTASSELTWAAQRSEKNANCFQPQSCHSSADSNPSDSPLLGAAAGGSRASKSLSQGELILPCRLSTMSSREGGEIFSRESSVIMPRMEPDGGMMEIRSESDGEVLEGSFNSSKEVANLREEISTLRRLMEKMIDGGGATSREASHPRSVLKLATSPARQKWQKAGQDVIQNVKRCRFQDTETAPGVPRTRPSPRPSSESIPEGDEVADAATALSYAQRLAETRAAPLGRRPPPVAAPSPSTTSSTGSEVKPASEAATLPAGLSKIIADEKKSTRQVVDI